MSANAYSAYIQPLDDALNNDQLIVSIQIPGKSGPVTILYADDMNLALSIKTQIKLKALGNPNFDHPFFEQLKWKNFDGIEILGIIFHTKYKDTVETVWSNIISKMNSRLSKLRFRKLSLKGKVTVLNSLILSKAWYAAAIIEIPDDKFEET